MEGIISILDRCNYMYYTDSYINFDVGFPSVCDEYVLLPLVNKEAASAYGRAEYIQSGRIQREREKE